MKIEIKNSFTYAIILCGEYESIKDCIERNKDAYLSGADLSGAYLRDADLGGADLGGADLRGADLRDADLGGADLGGADLSGAYLRDADLRGAYLRDADLSGADLGGADLRGAYLSGADLSGAYLSGANWNGEKLTKEPIQILGLRYFVLITVEQIKIGCEIHRVEDWEVFDDNRILKMDGKNALVWWRENKDMIFAIHEEYAKV